MRNSAAGYVIDHDRAGACEHEAERSEKFCDQLFPHALRRRGGLSLQFQLAILFAELLNFRANFFQQLARFRELFRLRSGELGWIWKRPV
jgi:hypothetical protein